MEGVLMEVYEVQFINQHDWKMIVTARYSSLEGLSKAVKDYLKVIKGKYPAGIYIKYRKIGEWVTWKEDK